MDTKNGFPGCPWFKKKGSCSKTGVTLSCTLEAKKARLDANEPAVADASSSTAPVSGLAEMLLDDFVTGKCTALKARASGHVWFFAFPRL